MKPEAMPMLPPKMRSWATMPWATAIKGLRSNFFFFLLDISTSFKGYLFDYRSRIYVLEDKYKERTYHDPEIQPA